MKISLFGATGRVGKRLLVKLLENGHEVKVLVRNPQTLTIKHKNLHVIEGDALDVSDIDQTIANGDIVMSALNTDGDQMLSESMQLIINMMEKHNVSRILTIGTAGILQARTAPHLYRFQSAESKRKSTKAAEDHLKAYLLLTKSQLQWTVICPTYLPDGDAIGTFRVEKDRLPENGKKITTGDTAYFAYSLIQSTQFLQCRVGIAY